MGCKVIAECPCGYEESFTVGGGRRDFKTNSKFPFQCAVCGIVSVNISADIEQCPKGADHQIKAVGSTWRERVGKYLPAPEVKRGGNEEIRSPLDKPSRWNGLGRAIKRWLKADKRPDTNVFSEATLRIQTEAPRPAPIKKAVERKRPRRIAQWGDRYIFDDPYFALSATECRYASRLACASIKCGIGSSASRSCGKQMVGPTG